MVTQVAAAPVLIAAPAPAPMFVPSSPRLGVAPGPCRYCTDQFNDQPLTPRSATPAPCLTAALNPQPTMFWSPLKEADKNGYPLPLPALAPCPPPWALPCYSCPPVPLCGAPSIL